MHSQEKRPNSLSPDEVATLMIWISNSHNAVWVVNSAVRVGQRWEKSCKAWSKLENLGNCMLTIYNISSNFFIELTLNGAWQSETAACRMISGTSCIQKVIQGEKKILGTSNLGLGTFEPNRLQLQVVQEELLVDSTRSSRETPGFQPLWRKIEADLLHKAIMIFTVVMAL